MRREYPEHPLPAVSCVLFNEKGQVLMARRKNPPAQGKWSLPGGVIKTGEELEDALKREMSEESGLEVKVDSLLSVSSRIVKNAKGEVQYHFVLLDYLCKQIGGLLKAGSDASEIRWVPRDEIKDLETTEGVVDVILKGKSRLRYNKK